MVGHLRERGLVDRFRAVCTGDEVLHTKPDPALYLLACSRLGVEPARAVAVEDSVNGVRAAKAAIVAATEALANARVRLTLAEDGRLTVTTAGGSVEDNVSRWRGQFSQQLDKESQEQLKVQDVEVTLVDFTGTYNDQRGNFSQLAESPNYRMLGAIFSVDGGLHFIKLYGPEKTIAARADEFRGFVQSLQLEGPAE